MDEIDVQEMLLNAFENLIDARDEVEGDDDDIKMADITRDLVASIEGVTAVTTFERAMVLTNDQGLVVRTAHGDVFQITIVQSRRGECCPETAGDAE